MHHLLARECCANIFRTVLNCEGDICITVSLFPTITLLSVPAPGKRSQVKAASLWTLANYTHKGTHPHTNAHTSKLTWIRDTHLIHGCRNEQAYMDMKHAPTHRCTHEQTYMGTHFIWLILLFVCVYCKSLSLCSVEAYLSEIVLTVYSLVWPYPLFRCFCTIFFCYVS